MENKLFIVSYKKIELEKNMAITAGKVANIDDIGVKAGVSPQTLLNLPNTSTAYCPTAAELVQITGRDSSGNNISFQATLELNSPYADKQLVNLGDVSVVRQLVPTTRFRVVKMNGKSQMALLTSATTSFSAYTNASVPIYVEADGLSSTNNLACYLAEGANDTTLIGETWDANNSVEWLAPTGPDTISDTYGINYKLLGLSLSTASTQSWSVMMPSAATLTNHHKYYKVGLKTTDGTTGFYGPWGVQVKRGLDPDPPTPTGTTTTVNVRWDFDVTGTTLFRSVAIEGFVNFDGASGGDGLSTVLGHGSGTTLSQAWNNFKADSTSTQFAVPSAANVVTGIGFTLITETTSSHVGNYAVILAGTSNASPYILTQNLSGKKLTQINLAKTGGGQYLTFGELVTAASLLDMYDVGVNYKMTATGVYQS